MMELATSLVV